jgi:hypothetical protein
VDPVFIPGLQLAREFYATVAITDPLIRQLPLTGAIDQFTDSTDAISDLRFLRASMAAAIHRPGANPDVTH